MTRSPARSRDRRGLGRRQHVSFWPASLPRNDPRDDIHKEAFLGVVLPKTLRDLVKAEAEANCEAPIERLRRMSHDLPRDDEDGKKLRRAFYALRNFGALGRRHTNVAITPHSLRPCASS